MEMSSSALRQEGRRSNQRPAHQGCVSDKHQQTTQQVALLNLITASNYAARTDILYFSLRRQKDLPRKIVPFRSLSISAVVSHWSLPKHPMEDSSILVEMGKLKHCRDK